MIAGSRLQELVGIRRNQIKVSVYYQIVQLELTSSFEVATDLVANSGHHGSLCHYAMITGPGPPSLSRISDPTPGLSH
jgi:hypothetical protein